MDLAGIRSRMGVYLGRSLPLEDGLAWAERNAIGFVETDIDLEPNALATFAGPRADSVRADLARSGIRLGLHTLSSVNVAEVSPYVAEAVDCYLRAYVDAAVRIGAGWVVVHAGYHFTADYAARKLAGLDRLKRIVDYAERAGMTLFLENMNWEPDDAEVHYLGYDLNEWTYYLDAIRSPALRATFTVNHAHLVPEGIDGHLDRIDISRLAEVRLADNKGDKEDHLCPGEGTIDFARLFSRLEAAGFTGHYMNAFGNRDQMHAACDYYMGLLS